MTGMTKDGYYANWYMPFGKSAVVELINEDKSPRTVEMEIVHAPLSRPMEQLGYFHAKWHRDSFPLPKDRWPDWVMLRTQGRGRFCGVMLHVWNPRGGWWGEGDEKFFVDGEKFPSTFGTGSEDYFGYAWCCPTLFQRPYHAQTMTQNNAGHQSVLRWHIADNDPFQTSFDGCIEKYDHPGPGVKYACTAFWYLSADGVDPYSLPPADQRDGYYDPGDIVRDLQAVPGYPGTVARQDMQGFPGFKWRDNGQLWWTGAQPGGKLALRPTPVKSAGKYALWIGLTKAVDYGIVQFRLDGKEIGRPVDLYSPNGGREDAFARRPRHWRRGPCDRGPDRRSQSRRRSRRTCSEPIFLSGGPLSKTTKESGHGAKVQLFGRVLRPARRRRQQTRVSHDRRRRRGGDAADRPRAGRLDRPAGDFRSGRPLAGSALQPSPARVYRSETHGDARMHMGGIGTGNVEIGCDGQFTTWQLFNTLRDGHVPLCFVVKAGGVSRLLQTAGGPNWPRVKRIEMSGEYPIATLRYVDAELPVKLELSALTPFAPLDVKFSSQPLGVLVFRVENPTAEVQKVSLAGMLQNAVGDDAVGPAEAKFGGNVNEPFVAGPATGLLMRAEPGKEAAIDRPTTIFVGERLQGLIRLPPDRPEPLRVAVIPGNHIEAVKASRPAETVIWLEEAEASVSEASLRGAPAGRGGRDAGLLREDDAPGGRLRPLGAPPIPAARTRGRTSSSRISRTAIRIGKSRARPSAASRPRERCPANNRSPASRVSGWPIPTWAATTRRDG